MTGVCRPMICIDLYVGCGYGEGEMLTITITLTKEGRNYGDGMAVFGTPRLYYTPKEELEPVRNEYAAWKSYVHDFLLSVLDKDDDFISEWNVCVQTPYRHDVSERDWYMKEINKALGKLDPFVQRIGFRSKEDAVKKESKETLTRTFDAKKVFIVQ